MEKACYGSPEGPLVTPEEFIRRASPEYKTLGILPYCRACSEVVEVYGVHSPAVTSRFDHPNRPENADPLDDCALARRNSRFRGLEPDGWDRERGQGLRRSFFQDDNMRAAYCFCLHMCGKGNFPAAKWQAVIRRADAKKIWEYADIELWVIPYILLTLENFFSERPGKAPYGFHFLFDQPSGRGASALWQPGIRCNIKKVFSDSGNLFEHPDNPYPVSQSAMLRKAGDVSWMDQSPSLLRSLRKAAQQ